MSKINNFSKKYKYYIFCFICVLLVLRLVYSRYNYLFVRYDMVFIPNIYIVTMNILIVILMVILPQYIRYMNKHYPNRDTIIKKFIRSNPVIKDTLLKSVEVYNNVYIYRLVDLDKYLESFKAYVKFKYISATFFREGIRFYIHLKNLEFKSLTFTGFISFISLLSYLFFMFYAVFVETYYYHIYIYNHMGILLIMSLIFRILCAWDNHLNEKELQEIDQKYEKIRREKLQELDQKYEKIRRENLQELDQKYEKIRRENTEKTISKLLKYKEQLISMKEQLETSLENEKDKNSEKYKDDSNRLKNTNETIIKFDIAIVDLGEVNSGAMSNEEFNKKWKL
jgi:hypothetical protein